VKQKSSDNIDGKSQIEFMGNCQLFRAKKNVLWWDQKKLFLTKILWVDSKKSRP